MPELSVKSNQQLAAQFYERGVAAARSGQRRLAAGLLSRAVQFDPHHEQAWLWLSGVVDDPAQVAFCLKTVLELNPDNERAKRGIVWLEKKRSQTTPLAPVSPIERPASNPVAVDSPAVEVEAAPERRRWFRRKKPTPAPVINSQAEQNSWWVGWRHSRQELGRARVLMWLVPILLLGLTLGLNVALRQAVDQTHQEFGSALVMAQSASPTATAVPTPVAVLEVRTKSAEDSWALAYLSALSEPRQQLNAAVETYREATSKLGNAAVAHATAARRLRDQIDEIGTHIATLTPPPSLEQAHANYLAGLKAEQSALDDMIEFYGSYQIQFANRAAIRMDEASQLLERARLSFEQTTAQANTRSIPARSPR